MMKRGSYYGTHGNLIDAYSHFHLTTKVFVSFKTVLALTKKTLWSKRLTPVHCCNVNAQY